MEYPVINYKHSINRFDFSKLTKEETKEYFTWFMSIRLQRIDNLQNYINITNDKEIKLDYTTESLIYLWEWFEPKITFRNETEEEINEKLKFTPEKFRETVLQNNQRLTEETFAIIDDIAIYFAETILVLLWEWFEPWIAFREVAREEMKKNKTPERLRETIAQNTKILIEQTFAMLSDIAIYFAETMKKNHP